VNPNWKTPLAMAIEALVMAGRIENARRLGYGDPDLMIYHNGRRMKLEEFIKQVDVQERDTEISPDFMAIIIKVL
ncbi:unnamed protein product, partial [marine sediment metagenome]